MYNTRFNISLNFLLTLCLTGFIFSSTQAQGGVILKSILKAAANTSVKSATTTSVKSVARLSAEKSLTISVTRTLAKAEAKALLGSAALLSAEEGSRFAIRLSEKLPAFCTESPAATHGLKIAITEVDHRIVLCSNMLNHRWGEAFPEIRILGKEGTINNRLIRRQVDDIIASAKDAEWRRFSTEETSIVIDEHLLPAVEANPKAFSKYKQIEVRFAHGGIQPVKIIRAGKKFKIQIGEPTPPPIISTTTVISEQNIGLIAANPEAFSQYESIKVVLNNGSVKPIRIVKSNEGEVKVWIEFFPNQFVSSLDIQTISTIEIFNFLNFSGKKVKLGSLVTDSRANRFINRDLKNYQLKFKPQPPTNKDVFFKNIENERESLVFLLGHINEKGAFEIEDAAGNMLFEVSLTEISRFSTEKGITIFPIGCQSAHYASAGLVLDVKTEIALGRLHSAISQSKNYYDFFSTLSSAEMPIVFSKDLIDGVVYLNAKVTNQQGETIVSILIPLSENASIALGITTADLANSTGGDDPALMGTVLPNTSSAFPANLYAMQFRHPSNFLSLGFYKYAYEKVLDKDLYLRYSYKLFYSVLAVLFLIRLYLKTRKQ